MLDSGATATYIAAHDGQVVKWISNDSQGYVTVANGNVIELDSSGLLKLGMTERAATAYPDLVLECTGTVGLDASVIVSRV